MVGTVAAVKTVDSLAKNKMTPFLLAGVVLLGAGIGYFGIVRPILCKVKVLDCNKNKSSRKLMSYKGFDPNYSRHDKVTLSHDRAKGLAKQIYKAAGFFNDDEAGFYAALEEAGSADNLSLVSRMFSAMYKKSLAEYITSHLKSQAEQGRIRDIINSYS